MSPFHKRLGTATALRTYRAHREPLVSDRWKSPAAAGARAQRLMWVGTGTCNAAVSDTLCVEALAAEGTIAGIPAETLLALSKHGMIAAPFSADAGYGDAILEQFRREGVDDAVLADRLQRKGAECGLPPGVPRCREAARRRDERRCTKVTTSPCGARHVEFHGDATTTK